jgi:hypothetical protein
MLPFSVLVILLIVTGFWIDTVPSAGWGEAMAIIASKTAMDDRANKGCANTPPTGLIAALLPADGWFGLWMGFMISHADIPSCSPFCV